MSQYSTTGPNPAGSFPPLVGPAGRTALPGVSVLAPTFSGDMFTRTAPPGRGGPSTSQAERSAAVSTALDAVTLLQKRIAIRRDAFAGAVMGRAAAFTSAQLDALTRRFETSAPELQQLGAAQSRLRQAFDADRDGLVADYRSGAGRGDIESALTSLTLPSTAANMRTTDALANRATPLGFAVQVLAGADNATSARLIEKVILPALPAVLGAAAAANPQDPVSGVRNVLAGPLGKALRARSNDPVAKELVQALEAVAGPDPARKLGELARQVGSSPINRVIAVFALAINSAYVPDAWREQDYARSAALVLYDGAMVADGLGFISSFGSVATAAGGAVSPVLSGFGGLLMAASDANKARRDNGDAGSWAALGGDLMAIGAAGAAGVAFATGSTIAWPVVVLGLAGNGLAAGGRYVSRMKPKRETAAALDGELTRLIPDPKLRDMLEGVDSTNIQRLGDWGVAPERIQALLSAHDPIFRTGPESLDALGTIFRNAFPGPSYRGVDGARAAAVLDTMRTTPGAERVMPSATSIISSVFAEALQAHPNDPTAARKAAVAQLNAIPSQAPLAATARAVAAQLGGA